MSGRRAPWTAGALLWGAAAAGCIEGEASVRPVVPGGDAEMGKVLLREYTCGGCHVIPGVTAADGQVGPPLTDWIERQYIAGEVWNTPENLVRWIVDPQAIEPGTSMPDMEVGLQEARHMAAYLYTLGDARPLGPPHPFPKRWLEKLGPGGKGHGTDVGWSPAAESGLPSGARTPTQGEEP